MDFLPGLSVDDLQHLCDDLTLLVAGQPLPGTPQELAEETAELLALMHLDALPETRRLLEPDQDLHDRLEHAELDLTDLWGVAASPLPQWALLFDALDILHALDDVNPDALARTDGIVRIDEQVRALFTFSTTRPDGEVDGDLTGVRVAAALLLDALVAGAQTVSLMLGVQPEVVDLRDPS